MTRASLATRRGADYSHAMEFLRAIFPYLIGASLVAVLGVLFAGILIMARGGQGGARRSNILMRIRVITQAVAVFLLLTYVLLIRP